MGKIVVVDYGMGNLRSVAQALRAAAPEADVRISSEAAAYAVEAAVIDTFRALRRPLLNVVLGHHHALYGWASTGTVASIYDAPALPEVEEPIVLLKIPKLWTPAMSEQELTEWAAAFEPPTPAECDDSEPVGSPPAGFESWDAWRAHRWPPSVP